MASSNAGVEETDSNIKNVYSVIDDSHSATYEKLNKHLTDNATDGNIYLRIDSRSVCSDIRSVRKSERGNTEGSVETKRQVWSMERCVLTCCVVIVLAGSIALITVLVSKTSSNSEEIDQKAEMTTATALPTKTTTEKDTTLTDASFWTAWGPWTTCSVTCGTGTYQRYRTCNITSTGRCLGEWMDQQDCTIEAACPVYGTWATWASWTSCDITCGGGTQSRYRTCNKLSPFDLDCSGDGSQSKVCSDWDCPDCSMTCTVGNVNTGCDMCICDNSVVTGRVTATVSGNSISDAAIFASSAPTKLLGQSDRNGFFTISAICRMSQLIVSRTGFVDAIVTVSSNNVQVHMDAKVVPYIKESPQSKSRLTGDNVTLCCKAYGAPAISYYEWFKDSRLVLTSWEPNGTQLFIPTLTPSNSGQYTCRANSPVGSIKSQAAILVVKDLSDEFCADALQSKFINLPSDCVQPDTNSTLYSVGECIAKRCRNTGSNEGLTCREASTSCCKMRKTNLRMVQCSTYQLYVRVVKTCVCASCSMSDLTVTGIAKSAVTGDKLRFGEVWVNGHLETYTSLSGTFSFTFSNLVDKLVITLKDRYFEKFLDAVKVIHLPEERSGTIFLEMNMLQSAEPVKITSTFKNTVTAGPITPRSEPILTVTIPPNAFAYTNGTSFSGTVKTSLTFLDTSNVTQLNDIPGEFQFVDEEGQTGNLNSLGVFNLYFEDESGNSLSTNEPIDVQIPSIIGHNVSTHGFKLWRLSSDTGIWEEIVTPIGKKRKKRSLGIPEVEWSLADEKGWLNIDEISDDFNACFFKIRVYEDLALSDERSPDDTIIASIVKIKDGILDKAVWPISHPKYKCLASICHGSIGSIEVYVDGNDGRKSLHVVEQTFNSTAHLQENRLDVQFSSTVDIFYNDQSTCERSTTEDHHVRFKYGNTSETFTLQRLYYMEQVVQLSPEELEEFFTLSRYTWYPKRDGTFTVCFIKINIGFDRNYIMNEESLTVRVTSRGGTRDEIKGLILGIREYLLSNTTNSTICVEYKCAGNIYPDVTTDFDYTNINVSIFTSKTSGKCKVQSELKTLATYKTQTNETNESQIGKDFFQVLVPHDNYGVLSGVYSSTVRKEANIPSAYTQAKNKCYQGEKTSENDVDNDVGVAVTFICTN